jgi:alpha-tubulin suppressor-like RCC1 family protein
MQEILVSNQKTRPAEQIYPAAARCLGRLIGPYHRASFLLLLICSILLFVCAIVPSKAHAACTSPAAAAGAIEWFSSTSEYKLCDGTSWAAFDTSPASSELVESFISAGYFFTCGVKSDGTGYCWGDDFSEQLGNSNGVGSANAPYAIFGGGAWQAVSAKGAHETSIMDYGYHACGIKDDSTGYCWGSNSYGELGIDSIYSTANIPVQISVTLPGTVTWKTVGRSISTQSCAIRTDDTLWCWGSYGFTYPTYPNAVDVCGSIPDTWKGVSTGNGHGCAIGIDDTLWCWGGNSYGQLGVGSTFFQLLPTAVNVAGAIPDTWKTSSTGVLHTCAIGSDNTLWCWGYDASDQLGNGVSTSSQPSPAAVDISGSIPDTWKAISVGINHSCAIGIDDTMWCWGSDVYGEVGNGSTNVNQASPVAVDISGSIPDTWKNIAAGGYNSCAIGSDDLLYCWGYDGSGQLGNGNEIDSYVPAPVHDESTAYAPTWNTIVAGGGQDSIYTDNPFTCGIKTDGTLWCWGSDLYGQLGNGSSVTQNTRSPYALNVSGAIPDAWNVFLWEGFMPVQSVVMIHCGVGVLMVLANLETVLHQFSKIRLLQSL